MARRRYAQAINDALLEEMARDPICEATLTGMAVGAAAAGYRVVLHMMFSNWVPLCAASN